MHHAIRLAGSKTLAAGTSGDRTVLASGTPVVSDAQVPEGKPVAAQNASATIENQSLMLAEIVSVSANLSSALRHAHSLPPLSARAAAAQHITFRG
jgi:hypothetical protein